MKINKKLVPKGLLNISWGEREYVDMMDVGQFIWLSLFGIAMAIGLVILISEWVPSKAENDHFNHICNSLAGAQPHYVGNATGGLNRYGCHIIKGQGTTDISEKIINL